MRLQQPTQEFWGSTPARVGRLFRAFDRAEARLDYRAGLIAATIVNVNRGRGKRAVEPSAFFPSLSSPTRVTDPRLMRESFLAIARAAQARRR